MSATASATTAPKKQCITCSKSGGVMICDGCQQAFCGKHVIEHRQQLGGQLDQIIQDFDVLQQESEKPPSTNHLAQTIDRWEKESIAKIQQAAKTARESMQVLMAEAREEAKKQMGVIGQNLRSSREADDFSEAELKNWLQQLKDLRKEMSTPSAVEAVYDKESPLYLIKIRKKNSESTANSGQKESSATINTTARNAELFLETHGSVRLSEESSVATHLEGAENFAYLRGKYIYRTGCHVIRFKIEKSYKPYRIFFGCMSTKEALKKDSFSCREAVGWFGSDQVYEHGRCANHVPKYGYRSNKIVTNDFLQLTLDCDQRQIRLLHERLTTVCKLSVNVNMAPFPWQFLVVLFYPGDSVRIVNTA